jgi:iron complex transport system substrate-binding protein
MKNKIYSIVICIAVIASILAGCGDVQNSKVQADNAAVAVSSEVEGKRTITDMEGDTVQLPDKIEKAGTSWAGYFDLLLTVGASEQVVAGSNVNNNLWTAKVFPGLKNVSSPFTNGVNMEELLRVKPDVLFLKKTDTYLNQVKETGIPIIQVKYTTLNELLDAISLAGNVFGGRQSEMAEIYKEYVNKNVGKISAVTKEIPDEKKPKILFMQVTAKEISVWGGNMLQDEIINVAGGINVAEKDFDNSKKVSYEQILQWNPDVIIIEGSEKDREILNDAPISAVKNGKVFISPQGVFYWGHLGSEIALWLPWLAKTLHPDKFSDMNISEEVKYFYKTFFKYDLNDDEYNKMLNEQPPD